MDMGSILVLDVGGVKYKTTTKTLCCTGSSYFCNLLNGGMDVHKTEDGHYFIDRNGQLFGVILEYLRNYYVQNEGILAELPTKVSKLKALRREAEFYALHNLTTQINSLLLQVMEKERCQNEVRSTSGIFMNEDENFEKEFDFIFHSASNSQCTFPEDRIEDLLSRVNQSLVLKKANGFKIKSSKSDLIFDATKTCPYVMFVQITLVRDRKPHGEFRLPISTPPLTRTRTVTHHLPSSPHIHPLSNDLASNESMEYFNPKVMPQGLTQRVFSPRSLGIEGQFPNSRSQQSGDFVHETMHHTQVELSEQPPPTSQQHRLNARTRWNYHPHYGSPLEWNESYELDLRQTSLSPREGSRRCQLGPSKLQEKTMTRIPVTPEPSSANSYRYGHFDEQLNDGRVNLTHSVQ
eukprot:g2173.t1